jgi:hypothetical protein
MLAGRCKWGVIQRKRNAISETTFESLGGTLTSGDIGGGDAWFTHKRQRMIACRFIPGSYHLLCGTRAAHAYTVGFTRNYCKMDEPRISMRLDSLQTAPYDTA